MVWQKARVLTREIYKLTRQGSFAQDHGLGNQIRRAAVSIMSNIAEGFERGGRAEFHQFLTIAKASCGELRSQLYIALDAHHISQIEFEAIKKQAEEISRMLSSLKASVYNQIKRPTPKPSRASP